MDKGELYLEKSKTVVSSQDDNLLDAFSKEYTKLLSHRRAVDGLNPELLTDAFFHRSYDTKKYDRCTDEIKDFIENVLQNMQSRFSYSEQIALDTIIYAIRKEIIDFATIIN